MFSLNSNLGSFKLIQTISGIEIGSTEAIYLANNSVYILLTAHPLRANSAGMYIITVNKDNIGQSTCAAVLESVSIDVAINDDGNLSITPNDMMFGVLYKIMF